MKNDTHPAQVKAWIQSWNPEALLMDGFDEALVGAVSRTDFGMVAVYDRNLCIDVLVKQGMDTDAAVEFFEYNCESAYMGRGTPVVGCFDFSDIDIEEAKAFLSEAAEKRSAGEE